MNNRSHDPVMESTYCAEHNECHLAPPLIEVMLCDTVLYRLHNVIVFNTPDIFNHMTAGKYYTFITPDHNYNRLLIVECSDATSKKQAVRVTELLIKQMNPENYDLMYRVFKITSTSPGIAIGDENDNDHENELVAIYYDDDNALVMDWVH